MPLLMVELSKVVVHSEEKSKPSQRPSILSFLTSLARRKRRLETTQVYLQHLDSVLNTCTYRESCRCLDCQNGSSVLGWTLSDNHLMDCPGGVGQARELAMRRAPSLDDIGDPRLGGLNYDLSIWHPNCGIL
ncbi:jg26442 [Pararge aegeria aegeria]|uniref:Jg26442 protein n=1 Tax=Pararge aegeria aegeria TaxID=348720 RepID=A0A8S4S9L6_9NEOP|nr:jg26442 [Pararge aegeria aegeria]